MDASAGMPRGSRKGQVSSFCTHTDLRARTHSHCDVDFQKGARRARSLAAMTLAVLALAAVALAASVLVPYKADLCVKAIPGTNHAAKPLDEGVATATHTRTHTHVVAA